MGINTIQSNIRSHKRADLSKYALFMGGTNVTHDALAQYDPLITGFYRLFMVRTPLFLVKNIPGKLKKFKHILEYGNTAIAGINDTTVNMAQYQGGYVGKSFEIPTHASDGTNSFSVTVYEFSGSPVREVIHTWINGTTDLMTGLTHYNGAVTVDDSTNESSSSKLNALQSNQTAEFIYVVTDRTGLDVEYACLIANAFPMSINNDVFNSTQGTHDLVETAIEFSATKYESIQINAVAKKLLNKHKILTNSLNFNSRIGVDTDGSNSVYYNAATGQITEGTVNDSTLTTPIESTEAEAYARGSY